MPLKKHIFRPWLITLKYVTACMLIIGCCTVNARAQEDPDFSRMGHSKTRGWLKENGLKTSTGAVVRIGDTLWVGKGTMPDKRFAFIYQSPTGWGSQSSMDMSVKAYLNSSAVGRRAVVKAFMTSGMRKGEYAIYVVSGLGEMSNYWIELDNAIEAGEIKLEK